MDQVLRGFDVCFIYIHDLLDPSKSQEEHLHHPRQVFERLREYFLIVNVAKFFFRQTELTLLGHKMIADWILPLIEKVGAIKQFPKPHLSLSCADF